MSKTFDTVKEIIKTGKFLNGEKKLFCNWLIAEIDFDCDDCINNIDNDAQETIKKLKRG